MKVWHTSDEAVRVALQTRPASPRSVIPIYIYIYIYIHLFIRFCKWLLILRPALNSNSYGTIFRVELLWTLVCVTCRGLEWEELRFNSPSLFILFYGKSVSWIRIPTTHTIRLVLYSYIYYVTCINFDALWKGDFAHWTYKSRQNTYQYYSIYTMNLFTSSTYKTAVKSQLFRRYNFAVFLVNVYCVCFLTRSITLLQTKHAN